MIITNKVKKVIFYILLLLIVISCQERQVATNGDVFYNVSNTDGYPVFESYFSNGQVNLRCSMKDEILQGPFEKFYPSGILQSKGKYINGEIEGELIGYNENSIVIITEMYKNGLLHGYKNIYNPNGDLEFKGYYLKDSLFYAKYYKEEIEFITPILTIVNDSLFVGDTMILQYRLPLYDDFSIDKDLYIVLDIDSIKPDNELRFPMDKINLKSSKSRQIGLKILNEGDQNIFGFVGDRNSKAEYKTFRKKFFVFSSPNDLGIKEN